MARLKDHLVAAANTARATRITLWMATLFGKKIVSPEYDSLGRPVRQVTMRQFRGKLYMTDYQSSLET